MRASSQEVVGYGQHVYAFCNVQTKQVLYSLRKNPKDSALKQLPDIGANHTPPTIRPDLWKPLYSVTLPSSEQGLRLFRKLKEWKKVHELYWKPPSYLSRSYTEKEIKELQDKLDNRGGSKKETVYDLIKREKKKMRQRIIMNQKANSIADLAAVLLEQEAEGTYLVESRARQLEQKVEKDIKLIRRLAKDFELGALKKIDDELDVMDNMLAEGVDGYKAKLKVTRDQTRQRREKLVFAEAVVREAKAWSWLSPAARNKEREYWKAMVEGGEFSKPEQGNGIDIRSRELWSDGAFAATMHRDYNQNWEQVAIAARAEGYKMPEPEPEAAEETAEVEKAEDVAPEPEQKEQKSWTDMFSSKKQSELPPEPANVDRNLPLRINWKKILPCFPARLDPVHSESPSIAKKAQSETAEKYGENRHGEVIFTSEGVKIEWADFLDAEFAPAWPEAIQHERMGGRREKLEMLQRRRNEKNEKYEMELAEMVEIKRREMGLVQEQVDEIDEDLKVFEDDETVKEQTHEESAAAQGLEAKEDDVQGETLEEPASELDAAQDLDAKEAAAREAAVKELKQIRHGRRLPPQLESIQSEILARVQAKGWKNAPLSQSAVPENAGSTPPPTAP